MHKKERSFSPFVLTVDLNAHLYTASSVNKIVAVIYNSICFWRNICL